MTNHIDLARSGFRPSALVLSDGTAVDANNPLPVSTGASGGLTDAQLRASPVSVSLASVPTHAVSQYGAWSVSISGTVPVSGPLTDAQLRASALPVSGTFWQATQPISASALPLPSGASTEATLAAIKAKTDNLDVLLSTRTKPADAQHVTVDNASVAVTGAFFQATQPVSIASMPSTPVTGTFWQATQPVSGPLTDVQLRASAVPVSGPLTDAQLRASAVPVTNLWPYPATVTPVAQQSANLAATQGTATLAAGGASKFTYLSDVQIFGTGATASSKITATIAGILGGTMMIPISVPAGVTVNLTPIILHFDPPLRASALNTAIVVTLPSLGSGSTHATVNAQGFQQ